MAKKLGRPTKFDPMVCRQAESLCKLGATDKELSAFFEIDEKTLNRWKHEFPEFRQSLKSGKELADASVGERLYQRACGYSHPELHISNYQGQITKTEVTKHYPPDTVACIFWLKNRRPEQWRDRTQQELVIKRAAGDLWDDELERIAAGSGSGASKAKGGPEIPSSVH